MTKKYDAMYIFASVKDDTLDKQIEKASAEITRLNGKVLSTTTLGKKNFARTMQKRESGVYVTIRFELDPAQVAALKARYSLLEDFFRVQILSVNERSEAVLVKQAEILKVREATKAEAAEKAAKENAAAQEDQLV
jgi:ribosomal protein S6